jgi:hypothetical protein
MYQYLYFLFFFFFHTITAYYPDYVQTFNSGHIASTSTQQSVYIPYETFTSSPYTIFVGIGGFSFSTTGTIDLTYTPSPSNSNMIVNILRGSGTTTFYQDLTLVMTNDSNLMFTFCLTVVGVEAINNYDLKSHPLWMSFAFNYAEKSLVYNVTYIPRDSSLFQTGMTANLSFRRLLCTNSIDNFNISLNVIQVSTYWVIFEIRSNGSTGFSDAFVDIIIFSQIFRGKIFNMSHVY